MERNRSLKSYTRDSSNFPRRRLVSKMFKACTQVPTRISAPAAAKDFAIAQPYPLSSATPAINALLPKKFIGKPVTGLLSSLSNFALVTPFPNVGDADVKERCKCRTDDT
nr:hypothetical protein T12_197 [Ipomoea batatas]